MFYVNKDDELTADEIQVVPGSQVGDLVVAGWRILAILGSTMPGDTSNTYLNWQNPSGNPNSADVTVPGQPLFVPQFIMGRGTADAMLHSRMLAAELEATAALDRYDKLEKDELGKLRNQVSFLQKEVEKEQAIHDRMSTQLDNARGKLTALELEVKRVRLEIGEARWREIIGSLEVEQIMDGTAPTVDDDDGVPF